MATVHDLLKVKGEQVWSISPGATVLEALKLLAEKDIGVLLVMDAGQIKGIISERDFARSIAKSGQCIIDGTVQDSMTKDVFTIGPEQSIEDCMTLMTQKRIRHLPVVDQSKLIGLISIGDVVRELISSKESLINNLENFIEGRGYGQ